MSERQRPSDLEARYAGAPESLWFALTDASARAPAILDRRDLLRARDRVRLPSPSPGLVPFPVVQLGAADGLIYRVHVSDGPRHDLNVAPQELVTKVTDWVRASWPELPIAGARLHFSGPPPGPRWQGSSCELALAAALVSWSLGLVPGAAVAVTGALGAPGRLIDVLGVEDKRALVQRHLGGELICPATCAHDAAAALDRLLGDRWRATLQQRTHSDASQRAREALDHFFAGRRARAVETAAPIERGPHDPSVRARAAWVLGAIDLHEGRGTSGWARLQAARDLVGGWEQHPDDPPDDLTREELDAYLVIGLLDAGRLDEAVTLGRAALVALGQPDAPHRRWRHVAVQLAGSLHRALIATGQPDEARELLRHYSLGRARLAEQRARAHADLAELERREGRHEAARRALGDAREHLRSVPEHARPLTARFLDLYAARQGATLPADPDGPLWPELGLELITTCAATDAADRLRAHWRRPEVQGSFALQWVVLAELIGAAASRPELIAVRDELVEAWQPGDAPLRTLLSQRSPSSLQEIRRRCPY